jgi:hypothetical protein
MFGSDFTNSMVAGDDADPDADGANNFSEFAHVTGPLSPEDVPRATAAIRGGYLTLDYTRPDPSPPEAAYEADTSPDLEFWCEGCGTETGVTTLSNGAARVTIRGASPAATAPVGFLRLRVRRL